MEEYEKMRIGDPFFQNQPSYTKFYKSFENEYDSFYALMNEVDVDILKEEQAQPSRVFKNYYCPPNDPRIGKPNFLGKRKYLKMVWGSALSKYEQAACVSVLLARQNKMTEKSRHSGVWALTQQQREKEKTLFQKHVQSCVETHKELIYEPMNRLVTLYKQWYEIQTKQLLQQLPDFDYSTYTGLPQLHLCGNLNSKGIILEDVKLVQLVGQVPVWPKVTVKECALNTLRVRLERYACAAPIIEPKLTRLGFDLTEDCQQVILPLESLLMLLTADSYIDSPMEMLLTVRSSEDSNSIWIEFQKPLPVRNCGWHTNNLLLEVAYQAYVAQPGQAQWLQFDGTNKAELMKDHECTCHTESRPNMEVPVPYKLLPMEENANTIEPPKTNNALISWRLNCEDENFLIHTALSIPAVQDLAGEKPIGCHFFKFENKLEYGCEIFTKHELLKAWLQMKLLQSNVGYCTRVSLLDFSKVMDEELDLEALENQLHEHYNINTGQLMSNFCDFIKLLHVVELGEYLLHTEPKYKDKFLLSSPTTKPIPQRTNFHKLLNTEPSNLCFMTQRNVYLPISSMLYTPMHAKRNIMPCAFYPGQCNKDSTKQIGNIAPKPQRPLKKKKKRKRSKTKRNN